MILYCIIFTVILSSVYENRANYNTYKLYYDLAFAFIKHLKLILDTYFEIQFIRVLYFFIRIKNIKRKEKYMRLRLSLRDDDADKIPKLQRAIKILIIVLFALAIFESITTAVVSYLVIFI